MRTRTASMLDHLTRLCSAPLNAKELRLRVLAEARRLLPFDAHVWLLTDPVSRVGTSPLATVPGLSWPTLPALIRSRYLTQITRWTDLIEAGQTVSLLYEATAGDLAVSPMWREAQHELGVVDVASVVFADRFGCWAWLDLYRYAPACPFTAADRDFLAALAAPLTSAIRQAQARTFHAGTPTLGIDGPSVLLLDPHMQVLVQTSAAIETLHRLNPPDEPIPAIPAAAYNVAAALIAHEHGIPVGPPWSRMHLDSGRWVTLRAARTSHAGDEEAEIAVSIEASTPAERLEVFALAHGLSRREREVVAELTTGVDSRALAQRLVLSEHTVNDHVKAILAKTGSTTRQMLLSRVAGTG